MYLFVMCWEDTDLPYRSRVYDMSRITNLQSFAHNIKYTMVHQPEKFYTQVYRWDEKELEFVYVFTAI